MIIPIIISLSLSFIAISCVTAAIAWRTSKNEEGWVELTTLSGMFFSSSPNFFMVVKAIVVLFNPDFPRDILYTLYAITVVFAYMGFTLHARKIFLIADKITGGFNYMKQWIVVIIVYFGLFSPLLLVNTRPILINEGELAYWTISVVDPTFQLVATAISAAVFFPFLYKFTKSLILKNKSRRGRINGAMILTYYELIGVSVFFAGVYANTDGTIVTGFVLQNVCAILLLALFRQPHAIEDIIMQLNIESVHVSTTDGEILRSVVFIPGRFSQGNDQLIGDLMKGTNQAMMQVLGNEKVGLQRIILNDGTIIMAEPSVRLDLVYIVCMRSYTRYTRKKVKEMRNKIDQRLAYLQELDRSSMEAEITPQFIMDVFL